MIVRGETFLRPTICHDAVMSLSISHPDNIHKKSERVCERERETNVNVELRNEYFKNLPL